jgi:HD-GYP domain-containing protein (c-di-GMP phosphodiesterase class II)
VFHADIQVGRIPFAITRTGSDFATATKERTMQSDLPKTKRISVSELRPGMYVLGLDQPWHKTPFFRHRFLVKDHDQIASLQESNVREVMIDASYGRDVACPIADPQPPTEERTEHPTAANMLLGSAPAVAGTDRPAPACARTPEEVGRETSKEAVHAARAVRDDAITAVKNIFAGTKTGIPIKSPALLEVAFTLATDLFDHPTATMIAMHLDRMQRCRRGLYEHAVDVCVLSLMIGRAHKLRPHELEHLGFGALMHDIGELELAPHLQCPSGALTDQEQALFRQHPSRGHTISCGMQGVGEQVSRIVWEHHERADGSGYPFHLAGSLISPLSQIVGLADEYDALVSEREGRTPFSGTEAVRRIYRLGVGGIFDLNMVKRMIQCLGVYPIGSLVELTSGERGWVIAVDTQSRLRPWVKLVWDRHGAQRPASEIVDLSSPQPGAPVRTIRQVLNPQQEGVDCNSILAA